jgi:hypothetical protein
MAESKSSITALQRLFRMLKLDRSEISYIFLYAIFAGLINLSIPLGIQAIFKFSAGRRRFFLLVDIDFDRHAGHFIGRHANHHAVERQRDPSKENIRTRLV